MDQDLEHLRLLSIFHYVVGGIAALSLLFPVLDPSGNRHCRSRTGQWTPGPGARIAARIRGMDLRRDCRSADSHRMEYRAGDPHRGPVSGPARPLRVLFCGRRDRVLVHALRRVPVLGVFSPIIVLIRPTVKSLFQ